MITPENIYKVIGIIMCSLLILMELVLPLIIQIYDYIKENKENKDEKNQRTNRNK